MKKFIAIALAVAAATTIRAASVEWSSGDLSSAMSSQADITDVTAYYFVITDKTAEEIAALKNLSQSDLYKTYFNENGSLKDGVTPSETVAANSFGVANWEQDVNLDGKTLPHTEYVVAIYQATSEFGGTYALASVASAQFTDGDEFGEPDPDSAYSTYGDIGTTAYANNSGSWAAVPEPTTVALLALGLAAVGLKRKVA